RGRDDAQKPCLRGGSSRHAGCGRRVPRRVRTLAQGRALAAAIRFAAAAAGLKCTRLGGSMAAPRPGEGDVLLARAPARKSELPYTSLLDTREERRKTKRIILLRHMELAFISLPGSG